MSVSALFNDAVVTTTLVGAELDLLSGGTLGRSLNSGLGPGQIADQVHIVLKNPGAGTVTVTLYMNSGVGGALVPQSTTFSLGATTGTLDILIQGVPAGAIRCTGNGTSVGVTATIAGYQSVGTAPQFNVVVNGVTYTTPAAGGTVAGVFSQSGGTATINATGAVSVDGSTSVTIGGTSATSLVLGRTAVVPSLPGGVSVASGKAVTGSGAMAVEATGALSLGVNASTTSIVIGQATVAPVFTGGINCGTSKTITGTTALTVDLTGTLNLGTTNATSIIMGKAAVPVDFKGGIQHPSADAGAGATSGTVNARSGTFTVSTGTSYVLTNSTILSTDQAVLTCVTASPGAYVATAICTSNTLTVTLSASVTSIKFFFLIIGQGG